MKLVIDNHNHTLSSGHAYSTIKEIIEEGKQKGFEAISITDHAPQFPESCGRMHFLSLPTSPEFILGVRMLPGVELNILNENGDVDLDARTLKRLTTVIASIHAHCYQSDSIEKNTNAYVRVMNNPYVNIIGHPGDPKFPFHIETVVAQAAKTCTAIEINATMGDPKCNKYPGFSTLKDIIRECIKQNVFLSFGSDSHIFPEVGDFSFILPLIEELNIPEHLIVNTSVDKYLDFVEKRRAMNPKAFDKPCG